MAQFKKILKDLHDNLREILELVASILLALAVFGLFAYHLFKLYIALL